MQFRYSCVRKSIAVVSKRTTIAVGLLVLLSVTPQLKKFATAEALPIQQKPVLVVRDARTVRLARFLAGLHCPVAALAEDFVQAADQNQLDWRLLPSISVIESGGGKAYRNNNIFGWDNGNQLFPTIRAGINVVAFKLGHSALYRHRDLLGKLHLYNPDQAYAENVIAVMNRISPRVELKASANRPRHQQNETNYPSTGALE